jgi:histidine triad (HIT) family protein
MAYDDTNVFAKILRGEIPNKTVLETEHSLAFHDIDPKRPTHILVIPKGRYTTYNELAAKGTEAEIVDFFHAVAEVARLSGVVKSGYRLICNNGADGQQEVPHLHVHVLGGAPAGPMIRRTEG